VLSKMGLDFIESLAKPAWQQSPIMRGSTLLFEFLFVLLYYLQSCRSLKGPNDIYLGQLDLNTNPNFSLISR